MSTSSSSRRHDPGLAPQPIAAGRAAARTVLLVALASALAGCDTTLTVAAGDAAPFVLSTSGEPVRASSPPGVEVTLGARRVLQADEPAALY